MIEGQKSPTETYKALSTGDALKRLGADPATGLSGESVRERVREYGYNEVPEKKQSAVTNFLKRFWGLTPWMLELTIVLSYILHRYVDLVVIAFLLVMNAVLGFYQEQQATRAVESLKQKLNVRARVLRDKVWALMPARDLVPGDIVRVRSGDFVPADIKVVEGNTEVDQSALTGESYSVEKKDGDILYSGSIVRRGESTGAVVSTGVRTYFGRTAQLVRIAKPRLYVEKVITGLLKWLLSLVIILLAIAFIVSYIRGISLLEILPLALVLLVSSIPVALPTMFTVTMALGSLALVKKGVLVTRLSATQDAAMMDELCVDKTGTITSNKLTIADIRAAGSHTKDEVILYGALASREANRDPIDLAFIEAARGHGLDIGGYREIQFIPFDPAARRTESTVEKDGVQLRATKGAVTTIAALCGLDSKSMETLEKEMNVFAARGYRTLAIAAEKDGSKMGLIGVAALYDAPRPESAKLIAALRDHGITTRMLTGDALPVATEVAKEIGLGAEIVRMGDLKKLRASSPEKAEEIIARSNGFAEIYPEDKYLIVKDLQAHRHVVGMTGDGVNDAPALRQAEVGIAVSNATDIAKGAASAVLTHEGLSDILELVRTGRQIHQRITTWILNKIIKTFEIVIFVVLAFLVTGEYVVSAFVIVLLLFLIDFVTIAISTDNVRPSVRPERWDMAALVRVAVVLGTFMVIESFGLLFIAMRYLGLTVATGLHTFALDMLLFGGMFTILVVRERGHFWASMPGPILLAALAGDIVVTSVISIAGIPGLVPIPATHVLLALGWYFVFALVVNDFIKTNVLHRPGTRHPA
ncbi:MAG: Copper-exporting P-type ATPase B [Methanocella sp. PtaU1.Bin125]|nr:MAG: Copper-exporting P-type ATPase B [Methanocella sp. PtaU1.Bin125]